MRSENINKYKSDRQTQFELCYALCRVPSKDRHPSTANMLVIKCILNLPVYTNLPGAPLQNCFDL